MTKDDIRYQAYMKILREELVPAMGCTEPIALAYCCAKARAVLGAVPDRCVVEASGNIIKNVKRKEKNAFFRFTRQNFSIIILIMPYWGLLAKRTSERLLENVNCRQ